MKVAVINYSGSVRKTLISSYLLAPRLTGAKFYAVETINQSASDLGIENVTSFKGDDFSRLIEGNDSNLLVVFYVQIMSNDFVMQFSLQA